MAQSTGRLRAFSLALAGVILPHLAQGADAPPPASAFGQTPDFNLVALSPDGKTIAMDRMTRDGLKVVLFRPGEQRPVRVVGINAGTKLRGLDWADSQTALIDASSLMHIERMADSRSDYEVWRTMAVGTDGSAMRTLLLDDGTRSFVTGAEVLPVRSRRPHTVSMVTMDYNLGAQRPTVGSRLTEKRRDDGWVSTLFDVDTVTGKGRVAERGTPYTQQWLVDPDGVPVARTEWKAETRELTVLARDGKGWRPVFVHKGNDPMSLAGLAPDGKAIVAIGENDSDRSKAWAIPLDGSAVSVAFEDPHADISNAIIDRDTGFVVGYWIGGAKRVPHYTDPGRAALRNALEKAFPDQGVYIVDLSSDQQRLLVMTESSDSPQAYYLVDRGARTAQAVGESYPGLAGARLGEVQEITYAARDGATIPAFLTLPPGKDGKQLPLVVLVHGGPESHDPGGFDWWAQFLATRGYAVLQPQFRGSTGYGAAHRLAGYRQWGGVMQDDVTDGVRHLVTTGVADPKRVCIVGASYGGYAALAGATLTPDLYACAVSVAGVSDLPQMIGDVENRSGEKADSLAYWKDHIGSAMDPKVIQASPARIAASVKAPILLLHGTDDTVVPIRQSDAMARALDAAGKKYEYVKLPGEDHWLSNGATRTEVLERIEAFLAKYL